MNKHFYSHLTKTEIIIEDLKACEMTTAEEQHIVRLIDSSTHHAILDLILSELSQDDKKTFITYLAEDNHDKIWNHLTKNIEDIEKKIKKTSSQIHLEVKKDIRQTKKEA